MVQIDTDDTPATRAAFLVDAVVSNYFKYKPQDVLFYPLLDHVALLIQRSLEIAIFERRQGGLLNIYSNWLLPEHEKQARADAEDSRRSITLKFPSYDGHGGVQEGRRLIIIVIRKTVSIGADDQIRTADLDEAEWRAVRIFFDLLDRRRHILELWKAFPEKSKIIPVPAGASPPRKAHLPSPETRQRILSKISVQLDYLYGSIHSINENTPHPLITRGSIGNVFAVLRYVDSKTTMRRGKFNYSTQLLLSESQRQAVDGVPSFKELAQPFGSPADLLEQQIGVGARSISDSVFSSGFVEFPPETPGQGRDSTFDNDDPAESQRRQIEQTLLTAFGDRLVHIPIHVGGVPWAIFFLVLPEKQFPKRFASENDTWFWIYRFYRTCVPLLADGMRRIARRTCFDEITSTLSREFAPYFLRQKKLTDCLRLCNHELEGLSSLLPFRAFEFEEPSYPSRFLPRDDLEPDFRAPFALDIASAYRVSNGETAHILHVEPDEDLESPFGRRLNHDAIAGTDEELKAAVLAGLNGAHAQALTALAARANFAGAWAHDVKNATSFLLAGVTGAMKAFAEFPQPEAERQHVNLGRVRLRAILINAVAVTIHRLARDQKEGARISEIKPMAPAAVVAFWRGVLMFLLHAKLFASEDQPLELRAIHFAPDFNALAAAHGGAPPDSEWLFITRQSADPDDQLRPVNKVIGIRESQVSTTLSDDRVTLAVAMLSEIVRNIRVNHPSPSPVQVNAVRLAVDIRAEGGLVVMDLMQVHDEFEAWSPPTNIPAGVRDTLALFGKAGLDIMEAEIFTDPRFVEAKAAHPKGGRRHAFGLRLRLNLIKLAEAK
jgi:hypothetical protein